MRPSELTRSRSNAFLSSTVLAGADLGVDHTFGGTGAGADTFGGGSIGAVKIGGAVTGGVIAAGLSKL